MTSPLDDLGPADTGLDYETQRHQTAALGARENNFTFDLNKCANCDEPAVYVLDRPQFETVAFCGAHIPQHYRDDAASQSNDAQVQSEVDASKGAENVVSTPDAPLSGVNDPEGVAKTAPVPTISGKKTDK